MGVQPPHPHPHPNLPPLMQPLMKDTFRYKVCHLNRTASRSSRFHLSLILQGQEHTHPHPRPHTAYVRPPRPTVYVTQLKTEGTFQNGSNSLIRKKQFKMKRLLSSLESHCTGSQDQCQPKHSVHNWDRYRTSRHLLPGRSSSGLSFCRAGWSCRVRM